MDFLGTCDDLVIMPSEQAVLALAVLYPQPAARGGGGGGGSMRPVGPQWPLQHSEQGKAEQAGISQLRSGLCSSLYLTPQGEEELKQ